MPKQRKAIIKKIEEILSIPSLNDISGNSARFKIFSDLSNPKIPTAIEKTDPRTAKIQLNLLLKKEIMPIKKQTILSV
jgi:hypothetical protein